jgi:sugar transferase (PEP-CTERM/EpsH1 system associated)
MRSSSGETIVKILWLKNNLLHPLDSGGKIRTYQMLRKVREKHEIHFAAFAEERRDADSMREAGEYCHRLFTVAPPRIPGKNSPGYYARVLRALFDRHPFTVSSYESPRMRELVARLVAENGYDVLVADFLAMCLNIPKSLPIPIVHFSHNVEAMIWRRHVENERNPFKRAVFMRERERVERFEREVIGSYAFTIAVSETDCQHFRRVYGASRVGSIGTGVDTEFYAPGGAAEKGGSILFLGSMDWMPNIDAVRYFVRNIYPFVKSEVPDASLSIVGRNPDASVTALGDGDSSIVVTGTVPDTRVYVDRSAVAVVPMRIGGGTRIKIYEIMAMAKTVVSTSIGAEGLYYVDGENILIADEPREFARFVIKALREREWRVSIGMNARNFVASRCSWEAVAEQFTGLLAHLKER